MDGMLDDMLGGGPVPALIVFGNARSILAFVGIVTLVLGVWHVDRTWDEMGSATYKRLVEAAGGDATDITIPETDLDAAFPFPWAFLLGWAIFGLSYLFTTHDSWDTDISGPNVICLLLCLALGVIASVPMGDAVRNRNGPKKKKLGGMFVLSWILLSIFTGLDEDWGARNDGLCIVLCLIGAITIIASMKILWAARKMGDTWEQDAKPNPNPIVYNMGGPMFVFGWFVFFVSMATATNYNDSLTDTYCNAKGAGIEVNCGLPIFFNLRTALTFASGCGMVPIVMMLDYAHDEGGKYVGFGTDGQYFGRFLETPIPFVSAWSIFGLATLFDLENGTDFASDVRTWVVIVICISQGIVAGVLIQTALYKEDMETKNKWSILFVLLFLALAINLGFTSDYSELNANGLGLVFGILGAVLVILGQKTVFGDRKRGDYFMQNNGAVNPNPIVYSYGEIFFMAGWIMLALAQSWNYSN